MVVVKNKQTVIRDNQHTTTKELNYWKTKKAQQDKKLCKRFAKSFAANAYKKEFEKTVLSSTALFKKIKVLNNIKYAPKTTKLAFYKKAVVNNKIAGPKKLKHPTKKYLVIKNKKAAAKVAKYRIKSKIKKLKLKHKTVAADFIFRLKKRTKFARYKQKLDKAISASLHSNSAAYRAAKKFIKAQIMRVVFLPRIRWESRRKQALAQHAEDYKKWDGLLKVRHELKNNSIVNVYSLDKRAIDINSIPPGKVYWLIWEERRITDRLTGEIKTLPYKNWIHLFNWMDPTLLKPVSNNFKNRNSSVIRVDKISIRIGSPGGIPARVYDNYWELRQLFAEQVMLNRFVQADRLFYDIGSGQTRNSQKIWTFETKFKENLALTVKKEKFEPFRSFRFAPLSKGHISVMLQGMNTIKNAKVQIIKNRQAKKMPIYISNIFKFFTRRREVFKNINPPIKTKRRWLILGILARDYMWWLIKRRPSFGMKVDTQSYQKHIFKMYRRLMRKAFGKFRDINKHRFFMKYFRIFFTRTTGYQELELRQHWLKLTAKGGHNTAGGVARSVRRFGESIRLRFDSLSVFLGCAPSLISAKEFVKLGCLWINGIRSFAPFYSIQPGDVFQIVPIIFRNEAWLAYEWAGNWFRNVKSKLLYLKFMQVELAILMAEMYRWPRGYELPEETQPMLSERWLRFYLRFLVPVKVNKWKSTKMWWQEYRRNERIFRKGGKTKFPGAGRRMREQQNAIK